MSKKKILIIDGNNMLHRAYYKYQQMKTPSGVSTGLVYGFPSILGGQIKFHKADEVLVIFDGGRDKKRLELLPDYKKRDKKAGFDPDDFYRQRDEVLEFLDIMGVPYILKKKREADDLIWIAARRFKRKGYEVVIISSDKDFHQLISKGVSIWSPKLDKRLTHLNLKKEIGYEPHECVDYLILDGDSSDNIKGMPGVGRVRALNFIKEQESISKYLTTDCEEMTSFPKNRLEDVFLLNRQLIDIRLFCRRFLKKVKLKYTGPTTTKIKKKKLAYWCSKHAITTFLKPDYIKLYEKLL